MPSNQVWLVLIGPGLTSRTCENKRNSRKHDITKEEVIKKEVIGYYLNVPLNSGHFVKFPRVFGPKSLVHTCEASTTPPGSHAWNREASATHPPGLHAWNREARARKKENFLFLILVLMLALALASHVWTRLDITKYSSSSGTFNRSLYYISITYNYLIKKNSILDVVLVQ